jgi:hypothetical protein
MMQTGHKGAELLALAIHHLIDGEQTQEVARLIAEAAPDPISSERAR